MNEINFDAASFIADNEEFNTIDIVDRAYEQGRKDKEREIAESTVFVSNRPIEDIVLETRDKAIKDVLEYLEENEYLKYGFNAEYLEEKIKRVRL